MRIAYLISAHCDPVHLERMVRALNEQADFFIHIRTFLSKTIHLFYNIIFL